MKKIFVAIVLLLSLILLNGCAQKDAKDAYLELEEKSIAIKEAKAKYTNLIDGNGVLIAGALTKMEYDLVFVEKGGKSKLIASFNMLGMPFTLAAFKTEEGEFGCIEAPMQEIECFKAEDRPELEISDMFTTIKELSKGISAIVKDFTVEYGEDRIILGRKCKGFVLTIKNKDFKEEKYNAFSTFKKYIKNETFDPETETIWDICLDEKTGIVLYEKVITTLTTKDNVQVKPVCEATIKKLEFEVSDEEFELPAIVKPNCEKLREKIEEKIKKANYCKKDEDCIPAGKNIPYGCNRFINKNADTTKLEELAQTYSESCPIYECKDLEPSCIKGKCVIKEKEPKVIITTDKDEYEQGEAVKLIADFDEKPFQAYNISLMKKIGDGWENVRRDCLCARECGSSEFCEDFLQICQLSQLLCWSLEKGVIQEWDQNQCYSHQPICKWQSEPEEELFIQPMCAVHLRAEAGTYKFKLKYKLGEECETESKLLEVESNEFTIKAPREIVDLCEKEKTIIEERKNDPECTGKEFKCVDGWSDIYYYDSRLVSATEIPEQSTELALPEELEKAVIGKYSTSKCSCTKPISYHISSGGELKESSCESFYTFTRDYNASCNGCILEWQTGCC